jgi:hypothetical protein
MPKVIFDMSMSLDGFVNAANVRPEEPLGEQEGGCARPAKRIADGYYASWINMQPPCRVRCCTTQSNPSLKNHGLIT